MTIARPRTSGPRHRPPAPRRGRLGVQGGRAAFLATGPTAWYDTRDLLTTADNTLANRVGAGVATMGSTAGSDTNDPVRLPYDTGAAYVYLPGTASNNLSIVKGAWAGTLHVTATLTDNTTATFTTTADPVLIGNVLLSAGRYKKFVVRDTDGNGTVRVTIEPSVETTGQASWTCTTGQTVTVNRSTTGLTTAVVTRPLLMADGTDDYLALPSGSPAFTGAGEFSVLVVCRFGSTASAVNSALFSSESASNHGLLLWVTGSVALACRVGNGGANTEVTIAGAVAAGQLAAFGAVIDDGTSKAYSRSAGFSSSGDFSANAPSVHSSAPKVGLRAYTTNLPARGEYFAVATWGRALAATDLDAAADYLLGTYG